MTDIFLAAADSIVAGAVEGLEALAGRRVAVAMSGGVDSSVVAALAHAAGCEVVGVTLQLYAGDAAPSRPGACCAGADIRDARAVADSLGFSHYVIDMEARFRSAVIDAFASSYAAGRTPVPCVECNRTVKFTDMLALARDLGAEALLTGHYVRRLVGSDGPELHRGRDPGKDQSYFLWATTRDQIDYLRFPLGNLEKREVRALAARFGLGVAAKPDSQDICFVGGGDYADIVEGLRPELARGGEIVDQKGRVLGQHAGIHHYTVGQRRGLDLGGSPYPLYVLAIDADAAKVTVGPRAALAVAAARLEDCNYLGPWARPDSAPIEAKVRSLAAPAPALWVENKEALAFDPPLVGVAPGQAAVLYDGSRVLGGGVIAQTFQMDSN
ncbi:tRNA 2-thiouridine(34) synthase MnmA [Polymorphobacter sp.]|uniref:tRNA 2-thiouridine(34) synthase MnmA n=1 Tax=Polymorphobacter sp. TaxID=1909290 RepID=UPI003F70DC70